MTVSVINGSVCLTPEEITKAKKGVDPSPAAAASEPADKPELAEASPTAETFGPALILEGSVDFLDQHQDPGLVDLLG